MRFIHVDEFLPAVDMDVIVRCMVRVDSKGNGYESFYIAKLSENGLFYIAIDENMEPQVAFDSDNNPLPHGTIIIKNVESWSLLPTVT